MIYIAVAEMLLRRLLRLPVRCLTCEERTYTSLKQFLKLRKERGESQEEGHRERRGPQ